MFQEGFVSKYLIEKPIYGTAGVIAQGALGTAEGVVGSRLDAIPSHRVGTVSRLAGYGLGATTRTVANVVGEAALTAADYATDALVHDAAVVGKVGYKAAMKTGKGIMNALTKPVESSLDNLFTGREFRKGAVLAGEILPFALLLGAAATSARQANVYGDVYGNPEVPAQAPSMDYDGMGATGDLAFALRANRHG